jgi:glutathione synthase/RimK-type ligase-like ATP-grasp enzyme
MFIVKFAIIAPINRYLGFSAPISPQDQFNGVIDKFKDVVMMYVDPQRVSILGDSNNSPVILDEFGNTIDADVYFAFSHSTLDREMTRYIIRALEKSGAVVINGYNALTIADDKALMAIELAGAGIPIAKSFIVSARSSSQTIIDAFSQDDGRFVISKTSGLTAGGVGVKPITKEINCLAPELWSSRLDNRPKIIQNDLDFDSNMRTVIRAYVINKKIIGCYTTAGYGIVNCAGLTRESVAKRYVASRDEEEMIIEAAKTVYCGGFCRVDAVGGNNFAIIEVNPVARIDAENYGIDVPSELIKYAKELYEK